MEYFLNFCGNSFDWNRNIRSGGKFMGWNKLNIDLIGDVTN